MGHKLCYLISIILLLEGCNKDSGTPTPTSATKKCYLVKSTSTNSSNDFVAEKTYLLNSDNKVLKVTTVFKNASTSFASSEIFHYASNGKISKEEGTNYYITNTYNASNQLISSSYYVDNIVESRTDVTYSSTGQLVKKFYSENKSGALTYTGYRTYEYAGNTSLNATKESFYNTANILQFTVEYEYDKKSTPLTNIEFDQSLLVVPSVNNKTKSTHTQIAGLPSVSVTVFAYQYNDESYPSQMITTSSYSETINYVYDCK